jgi:hypothetical protein
MEGVSRLPSARETSIEKLHGQRDNRTAMIRGTMRNVASALVILLAAVASSYAQVDVNGTWRVDGEGRDRPWKVVLAAEGSRLTGW